MRHKNRLLVSTLKQAINRKRDFVTSFATGDQKDNPQVIEMRIHDQGQLEALEAVLSAIHGDPVWLNIMAGK